MATIVDIARKAGVSPRTVSRALNTGGYVGKETLKRIQKIAEELGYRPHAYAQSMTTRKTNNIAFVLCDRPITESGYFRLLHGVDLAASGHGYKVLFSSAAEFLSHERELPLILRETVMDGVIATGKVSNEFVRLVKARSLPLVLMGVHELEEPVACVQPDYYAGARISLEYLAGLGHRAITLLSGPLSFPIHREFLEGFQATAHKLDLDCREDLVLVDQVERLPAGACSLLLRERAPTAVIACNDTVAVRTMEALREAGLTIPDDVSLMGFGGSELGLHVVPRLTSVLISGDSLPRLAVRCLLDQIEGSEPDFSTVKVSAFVLAAGESCTPPRP